MKKKYTATTRNVVISNDTHTQLISFIKNSYFKIGRFADEAIKEKIEREKIKSMQVS